MILDEKMGLSVLRKIKTQIIDDMKSMASDDDDWDELNSLLDIEEKEKYLFSQNVTNTLDSIRVKDDFDCNILLNRKTINGIILLDKYELFVFNTVDENLRVIHFKFYPKIDNSSIKLFTFKILSNKVVVEKSIEPEIWKKFIQSIIYLDFLPTETVFIAPKERFGKTRSEKIINNSTDKFVLVTKAWNHSYKTLPNERFLSRAHWAIRWTGKGRIIPKLTFIKASLKGMNKRPEKETKR